MTLTTDGFRPAVDFDPAEGIVIRTHPTSIMPAQLVSRDAFKIPQGASWNLKITWREDDEPVDLSTGYTATFTLAPSPEAAAALTLTAGSGITLGAATQNIVIVATPVQTAALAFVRGWAALTLVKTGVSTTRLLVGPCDVVG